MSRQQIITTILSNPKTGLGMVILTELLDKAESQVPVPGTFNASHFAQFAKDIRNGRCNSSQKILYIKRAREICPGLGLIEAKYLVEDLMRAYELYHKSVPF